MLTHQPLPLTPHLSVSTVLDGSTAVTPQSTPLCLADGFVFSGAKARSVSMTLSRLQEDTKQEKSEVIVTLPTKVLKMSSATVHRVDRSRPLQVLRFPDMDIKVATKQSKQLNHFLMHFCANVELYDSLLRTACYRIATSEPLTLYLNAFGCPSLAELDLHPSTQELLHLPNAGGSSILSEAFSFEILNRLFQNHLHLVHTEMSLHYFPRVGTLLDYTCSIGSTNALLAVSVTRAVTRPKVRYTLEMAQKLVRRKRSSLISAVQRGLYGRYDLVGHVLHVWADSNEVAHFVRKAWYQIEKQDQTRYKDRVWLIISVASRSLWHE